MAQKSTRSNLGVQGESARRTITSEFKIVNPGRQHDSKYPTFLWLYQKLAENKHLFGRTDITKEK